MRWILFLLLMVGCGQPGPKGQDGTNGESGSKGPKGDTGSTGAQGQPGLQGASGNPGIDGLNGTTVTTIRFCPVDPSHPTTFPEYGLKIGSDIYGIYSVSGQVSWLAKLIPGTYVTTTTGLNCTFTINSDGTISY